MNNKTFSSVVLYSYMRPELTNSAIERVLAWDRLKTLYISIDGLRSGASREEIKWRNETINICKNLEKLNSNIVTIVWEINSGLTGHTLRMLERVFSEEEYIIGLEEDQNVSSQGLSFLLERVSDNDLPKIATAFSRQIHKGNCLGYRVTWFPEQWGLAFNKLFYLEFLKVIESSKVDIDIVRGVFYQILGKTRRTKLAIEKWVNIFNSALISQNWTDAIFHYTAIKNSIPYAAPWGSYTEDLGHLDFRSLNPRTRKVTFKYHKGKVLKSNFGHFCHKCERINSGTNFLFFSPEFRGKIYRLIQTKLRFYNSSF